MLISSGSAFHTASLHKSYYLHRVIISNGFASSLTRIEGGKKDLPKRHDHVNIKNF